MGRLKHTQEGMELLAMASPPPPGALIKAAKEEDMRHKNNYLMDLENWLLEHRWPLEPLPEDTPVRSTDELWMKPFPRGPRRFEDSIWAQLVQESLEENGSITWDTYTEWCLSGGGDEWFVEEE